MALKILYIVGSIVVAVVAGGVLVFSLGQRSVAYELRLRVLDAAGRPLPAQRLLLWDRSSGQHEFRLDENGHFSRELSESFGSSALGPLRPESFGVRLVFPDLAPLYYWFAVRRSGPVSSYEVYNDYYSSGTSQWVGDFNAQGFTRRQTKPDATGAVATAVPPRGGQVPRWQATATLQRAGNTPDGRRKYTLDLTLQQSGTELVQPD
ncbi:hypothetical protein [Hymenobacter cellulosivorans]|uniref:DUF2207 domain-containing protein n=1 Tax=Hymenobacter cellulosivorans TaxID=2932249 RepID=A0ABY4F5R8_9BACT|nr:hypothetical protein [Hymenobacter cellulosivorans]UOQ52012.1 hypothetical protein MUN80_19890 [Hymenobacter cellulosivorans]